MMARMISAMALLSFAVLANSAPAKAHGIGILSNPERFRELTGLDLGSLDLLGEKAILRTEGADVVVDQSADKTVTWQIFEDKGEEGVELTIGAAQNGKILSEPRALAIAVSLSVCGGPNEPVLRQDYAWPFYITYCRMHNADPRRAKRVYSHLPGNTDPNSVVWADQLFCNDGGHVAYLNALNIWHPVCL
jgi:hypothetical protein